MIKIDKNKVKEVVGEIEQSSYFQNVLSQVKKIRALRKDKNLKEKYKIWKKISADSDYNILLHYLKYYKFELPDKEWNNQLLFLN